MAERARSTNVFGAREIRPFLTVWIVSIFAGVQPGVSQTPDSAQRSVTRIIGIFDSRSGAPLSGVQVRDVFSGTFAMTTATGTARLSFLTFRGDAAFVELRKLGFEAKQIIVSRADTASLTEVLEPVAMLAPVVTTERYRIDRDAGAWGGFEQRCQSKSVTCIRNEDLEKRPTSILADFLIRQRRLSSTAPLVR